ncbi:DUF1642 domain-containing protein [Enterococcus sp. SMC-9]|uniref:DUF1642 domain-containing protein n=1 Tax=Enterococcus sp. SMC-9 TaxID=2862343 RepID=UPI001E5D42E6|nr:DUF1642 domain-containing protein [Enterococcus sp. SMC-9]MCD1025729.1 DUF1642 domain-containing protein [Enterococcus sp. SMC-9]
MNKQELIERIALQQPAVWLNDSWTLGFNSMKEIALDLAKELDEPVKPEVPQFVADWFESNKDDLEQALYETTIEISEKGTKNEFEDWFIDGSTDSYEILTRMKYGYTVKQEPKWIVKTSDGYWVNSITSNLHNSKVIDFSDNKRPSLIFLDKKTAEAVATLIDGEVEEV